MKSEASFLLHFFEKCDIIVLKVSAESRFDAYFGITNNFLHKEKNTMSTLKKLFPLSWKYSNDTANLIIGIIIHLVACVLVGALITLATFITVWVPVIGPIIAWALGIVSSLVGIYFLAGIVIEILIFAKVIKD